MVDLPAARFDLPQAEVLAALQHRPMRVLGQFMWGSNFTFLVEVEHPTGPIPAVYKPARGERPLWDFPEGTLAAREVAAFECCRALGWAFVPPTVLRADGPAGAGSAQLFVDVDPERHFFSFTVEERQRLRPVALFDCLINNADRKGGHILLGAGDKLWLIDHGVCFHEDDKLRTVVWEFAGQPIPEDLLAITRSFLAALDDGQPPAPSLAGLLSPPELAALRHRAARLLQEGRFPQPGTDRPYPWPLV
jgi:uncharacterized repeat protein (TIGR03843 family)